MSADGLSRLRTLLAPSRAIATDSVRGVAVTDVDAGASVVLAGVSAGYGQRAALEDVSLTVQPGSLLAVIGPNGAGKSTLLKLIAGLIKPWSGRISVLGAAPGVAARRIAYLPQAEAVD